MSPYCLLYLGNKGLRIETLFREYVCRKVLFEGFSSASRDKTRQVWREGLERSGAFGFLDDGMYVIPILPYQTE